MAESPTEITDQLRQWARGMYTTERPSWCCAPVVPMRPNPMAETSRPLVTSLRG